MSPPGDRTRWPLVIAAGLAVFLAQLDTLVVGVALPSIATELHTRPSVAGWTVLAYLLPMIALALPSGRWLDQVGTRAALTFAVTGFAVGSAAAGLAPEIGVLIAARAVQGGFAAVLLALVPALATGATHPAALGRAQGVVAALGALGAVSGPTLGGVLVETLGWRSIFYVNLPVAVLVAGIGLIMLPSGAPLRRPSRAWAGEALLLGSATGSVLLGLFLAAERGLGWLAVALAAVPPLLVWWRIPASRPVRQLLTAPRMPAVHLSLTATYTGFIVVVFLVPFYLERVLHTSPAPAGRILLALPAAQVVSGAVSGGLADRFGHRRIALIGTVVLTVGLATLIPLGIGWNPADLGWRLAVIGLGAGMFIPANGAMAMSATAPQLRATTGATTNLARQLGIAVAPAMATAAWAASGYALSGMRVAVGLAAAAGLLAVATLALARSAGPARGGSTHHAPHDDLAPAGPT